jgi:hypothetical protein
VQLDLNQLGTAEYELDQCEAALADGAAIAATAALDRADEALSGLRTQWESLNQTEQQLLGQLAKPIRCRRDALAQRLPAVHAVSVGKPDPAAEAEEAELARLYGEQSPASTNGQTAST